MKEIMRMGDSFQTGKRGTAHSLFDNECIRYVIWTAFLLFRQYHPFACSAHRVDCVSAAIRDLRDSLAPLSLPFSTTGSTITHFLGAYRGKRAFSRTNCDR